MKLNQCPTEVEKDNSCPKKISEPRYLNRLRPSVVQLFFIRKNSTLLKSTAPGLGISYLDMIFHTLLITYVNVDMIISKHKTSCPGTYVAKHHTGLQVGN
jgi:hypothetical protein